jgi:hypothetical protein
LAALTRSEVNALLLAKVVLPRSPPLGNFPLSADGDGGALFEGSPSIVARDGENIDFRAFFLLETFLVAVFSATSPSLRKIDSYSEVISATS